MLGVEISNIRGINELGYSITENDVSTLTKIFYDGECVAKISLRRDGMLRVTVSGKKKMVKSLKISPSFAPRTVLMELEKTSGKTLWCQLPPKDEIIFW